MSTNAKSERPVAFIVVSREEEHFHGELPPIVRIILTQAAEHRGRGAITEEIFVAQVRRLEREGLAPRGLELQVRDLSCGSTRFLIRAKANGSVREMIEYGSD